ncbi:MAG: molybdate ABC transporter substrate-binding protein [Clostridium sp.]|nr:molybdate ABC transporter substrate-binding protein [Clostridium sp.]
MKNLKKLFILGLTSMFLISLAGCNKKDSENDSNLSADLNISAAASLKEAMADIQTAFNKDYPNINLTFNFGASGSLQKQIEQGAPCDVFISAGESQMTALSDSGLLADDSEKTLLKNNLVLITSSSDVTNIDDLLTNKVSHVAIGDPASVPAGKYAEESLINLNMKNALMDKLVYAKDVKEVLAWTVAGNSEAGFVYKSDTYGNDSVKIIDTISDEYHSPINYPVAIIKDTKNLEAAKDFENFLFSDTAKEIFEKYGYEPY